VKNKLTDLNDALFAQLERLANEDLAPEAIEVEIKRSAAVVDVADAIVRNAGLQLAAFKLVAENRSLNGRLPAAMGLPSGGVEG
jgi:hypothetical protein